MHIHRSAHTRYFTTLGNEVLRDNRLSFCARGILGHLLSLPDGQRADIRTLADRTPEGRERVAAALRELEKFGYLKRAVMRTARGRLYTKVEVFDSLDGASSQVEPDPGFPEPGRSDASSDANHPVKKRDEETTLPRPRIGDVVGVEGGREGISFADSKAAADVIARVARAEPKLALGWAEALQLAPLVAEWRRRGASDMHIISSLTAGLPHHGVHHPLRFIEARLRTKMPAERSAAPPRFECDSCRAPASSAGNCRNCRAGEPFARRTESDFAGVRSRGVALARAALRGLSVDAGTPAPS
ncbi:MAG TPA: helix-turn-helix domain-containing protein [Actinospica sp.]|jgi:hypothetical protein|nr:helix-turn-helix domain-containing protein [Actinospica sp.]